MGGKSESPDRSRLSRTVSILSISKSFAVIVGIIIALAQLIQSDRLEKRMIAIEAVDKTRSSEFLKAYSNLKFESPTARIDTFYPYVTLPLLCLTL